MADIRDGMDGMDGSLSIPEVEGMILALYEPVPAETVALVQEALHRLQRSPRGWSVARDLLERPSEKVRFFGALTLVVKLNTDSSSLGANDLEELLASLLSWVTESASENPAGLVTRKLSTALVTFFLRSPQHANGCIHRLIHRLHSRQGSGTYGGDGGIEAILPVADWRTLQTTILFATDLIEEAGKVDMNSAEHFETYEVLRECLPDAVALISRALVPDPAVQEARRNTLREDSLRCFQAWVSFTHRFFPRGDDLVGLLRAQVPKVLSMMTASEGTFTASMDLFTELLSNQQGFLTRIHEDSLMGLCESNIGTQLYSRMLDGDFSFENCQFGFFMLALGESRLENLVTARDARSQELLTRLRGLLTAKGYPVAEDTIFVAAVEFWSSFTETICDSQYAAADTSGESSTAASVDLSAAIAHATEAVQAACRKIVFPPPAIVAEWDSAEREGFAEARKDVADLLQSMYTISGPPLATMFAGMVPQLVVGAAWEELEAAAFCLGSLADCISGDPTSDGALAGVFSTNLLILMGKRSMDTNLARPIPSRTRQTCISLIEKFATYFERNTANLPGALDLLFSALDDAVLGVPASKAVYRLCSSCRSALLPEVPNFLAAYQSILHERNVDCLVVERVMGGIACVVQAISGEHHRLTAVNRILDMLCLDAQRCLRAAGSGAHLDQAPPDSALLARCGTRCLGSAITLQEVCHHSSLRLLRCLLSLAKGLQVPADSPIDLDSPGMAAAAAAAAAGPGQYEDTADPEMAATQARIMAIMTEFHMIFPASGELVETACGILRAGFAESAPGPFVFSSAAIAEYLVCQPYPTPRIGALVSAACSFVNSHAAKRPSARAHQAQVLVWVIGLLHQMPDVDADPELAQNGIEFVCRLLVRDTGLVMAVEPATLLSFFFSFTLGVLDGREPLPKATAAEFWATLASFKPGNNAYELVTRAMTEVGPALMLSLVRNVGGNAARSELDKLSDPLKKLAAQHTMAASWLEAALFDPSFPSEKVSDVEKRVFARKVVSLRGARTTNQVVRDFWLASRGTKFAYAS